MTHEEALETMIRCINGQETVELDQMGGALDSLIWAAMNQLGAKKVVRCHNCKAIVFVRRLPKSGKAYCQADKCRKIMKLGHEKPVSLKSIPACGGSPYREMSRYEGGYTE